MNIDFKKFLNRKRPLVYSSPPENFDPIVQVAGCFCTFGRKHLQLKRAKGTVQECSWTMPGGKIESGETQVQSAIRETFEETGIRLEESELIKFGELYVRHEDYDYTYHIFHHEFSDFPHVSLSKEHTEFKWVTFEEVFDMPLMLGSHEIIHYFRTRASRVALPRKSFYFIRHGEIDLQPDSNPNDSTPLNARGKLQSEEVKGVVSSLPIESVCFSPMLRAQETKDILTQGLDIKHHEVSKLEECSLDIWRKILRLEEAPGYPIAIEVENFMFSVLAGMHTALDKSNLPLIVAHGGVHWVICYHLMIKNHSWKIDNCLLLRFDPVGKTEWRVTPVSTKLK